MPHKDPAVARDYFRERYKSMVASGEWYREDRVAGRRAADSKWARVHPERARAKVRRYRLAHPDKIKEAKALFVATHPTYERDSTRRKRAARPNMRREELRIRRERLAGRPRVELCEICGKTNGKRPLCFDHDHATGEFRGWICHRCNSALGYVRDDVDILDKMIVYLVQSRRPKLKVLNGG